MTNPMTDAMQTIRDLLVEISDWTVPPYAGARPECHFCGGVDGAHNDDCISLRAKSSLTALDSLAGAPSGTIGELIDVIREDMPVYNGEYIEHQYATPAGRCVALIQARDERIRREYAGEIALLQKQRKEVHKLAHLRPVPTMIGSMLCNMLERHAVEMAKRADIITPEATNGQ